MLPYVNEQGWKFERGSFLVFRLVSNLLNQLNEGVRPMGKIIQRKIVFAVVVFSMLVIAFSLFIPGKVLAQNANCVLPYPTPPKISATPELGSLALFGAGCAGWLLLRFKRRK